MRPSTILEIIKIDEDDSFCAFVEIKEIPLDRL